MPHRSSSLRSSSRRRALPSPLQVFLSAFLTAGVMELPVPQLVLAYCDAWPGLRRSVADAWASLGVLEAMHVLDLVEGIVFPPGRALCPQREHSSAFLATARLRLPLDEARTLTAVAAAPANDRRPAAKTAPDVSMGARPPRSDDTVVPSGAVSAAATANTVTEDERAPVALALAA